MATKSCQTCWAMVPSKMEKGHEEWHDRIAQVAIENTRAIEELTRRIQEIEAGYGDR